MNETVASLVSAGGPSSIVVSTLVSGDKIYVGHVGDSRVYRVREGGIAQLTRDHSLLEDYKEAKPDMTEEEQAILRSSPMFAS